MLNAMKAIASRAAAGIVALVLACTCGLLAAPKAYAVTAAEVEAQAQEVLLQLHTMEDTLEEASQNYFQCLYEYQAAIDQRDIAQARIYELEEEISELQGRLGNRAREMYRGGAMSFFDMLMSSASFEEFATSWDMLNRLNELDADLTAQTKALKEEGEAQHAEYVRLADLAEKKSQEAAAAYEQAQALVKELQETYDQLSEEAQELYYQEQLAAQAAAAAAAQAAAAAAYANDDGTVTDIQTGKVYSSASEYTEATGNPVVDRARAMIGADYVYGGTGGDWGGFDCSGFVSYALSGEEGVRLGTTATFIGWNQVSDPQPGDVCVIHNDNSQHTGIYIGNGRMIHASTYGVGVVESDVQSGMIYVRP